MVAPYELGFIAALAPIYLRGLSYLMIGSGLEAAAEFQRLLACRGSDPFSPFHAVAPLGLARALTASGNVAGGAHAYERSWPDGGKPMPTFLCFARRARNTNASGAG